MRFELKITHYIELYKEYDQLILAKGYKTTGDSKMYQSCLREFLSWLEVNGVSKVKHITTELMGQYTDYIVNRPKFTSAGTLSQSMLNKHFFSIRIFFDYLLDAKILDRVVHLPSYYKAEINSRHILTIAEVKELYDNCTSKVEKAMLSIVYGCGLRRNEIEQLNCRDIQFSRGVLIVVNGKGNKSREIAMSDAVIKYLKDYLINERDTMLSNQNRLEHAFLINKNGNRMSGASANNLLKKIIERTENEDIIEKKITLHCLRHTISTHLIEQGAEMNYVREFLGHTLIDTVHLYAKRRKRNELFTVI